MNQGNIEESNILPLLDFIVLPNTYSDVGLHFFYFGQKPYKMQDHETCKQDKKEKKKYKLDWKPIAEIH